MTHICVCDLTIIVSDNGLSPDWRQAIIWTNVGLLSIGTLGTNFSEILIKIQTFSFKKMQLKMSQCVKLNEQKWIPYTYNELMPYLMLAFCRQHLQIYLPWRILCNFVKIPLGLLLVVQLVQVMAAWWQTGHKPEIIEIASANITREFYCGFVN